MLYVLRGLTPHNQNSVNPMPAQLTDATASTETVRESIKRRLDEPRIW
jgi:hypothetical protein